MKHLLPYCAALLLLTSTASAQIEWEPQRGVRGRLQDMPQGEQISAEDRRFMSEAAQAGLAEVRLGSIGMERAENEAVRQFAEQMIADHGRANEKLIQLAEEKQIELPERPSAAQEKTANELEKLTGEKFDHEYMRNMLKEHEKAVAMFERGQRSSDPELRQYARETLPLLQQHLSRAKEVSAEIGVQTSGAGSQMNQDSRS